MAETNLTFSKVVANPTPTAWSQAYSAGRLFAAISLKSSNTPQEGEEHLNALGKDLISTLESEFFTLEKKDLDSIREAVNVTNQRIKGDVSSSFVICYLNENILYLFAKSGGKAILKRGDKIGTVIQAEDDNEIKSASGYVQEEDIIVLQTKSFVNIIPHSTLASSLDRNNPAEISEDLAPHIHEKTDGGASAVILLYKKSDHQEVSPAITELANEVENEEKEEEKEQENTSVKNDEAIKTNEDSSENIVNIAQHNEAPVNFETVEKPIENGPTIDNEDIKMDEIPSPFLTDQISQRSRISKGFGIKLPKLTSGFSHSRKIIATIAIILITVILIAAFLAIRSRQGNKTQAQFNGIFTQAEEKYNEGLNLKDLNASLAQDSFKEAKNILEENKDTFKNNSDEDNQIEDLLSKVNKEITGGQASESQASEVDKSESKVLSYQIENSAVKYITQNEDFIYFTDSKGLSSLDKGNNSKKSLIDKTWKEEAGIGVFGSNLYLLDKTSGISKFTPNGDDYSESDYLKENEDLEKAVSMTIDGSIYVLFNNGSVNKYTRGTKDDFSFSGLDKDLSSPTRIFTGEDFDNLYILDNGNSRVVVVDKEGKFVKSYSASIIKSAKDIDVSETDKRILILSGGKIFKIDIN